MKRILKIWLIFFGIILILSLNAGLTLAGGVENTAGDQITGDEVLLEDVEMAEDLRGEPGRGPTGFNYWANFITALVIVVILIWAAAWIFRFFYSRFPGAQGRDDFRVLNSIKMTTQSSLFVVRFIDEIYILAVTPQNVNVVSRIDDPTRVKEIIDSMAEMAPGINPHAFGTVLQKRITERIENQVLKRKQESRTTEQQHFQKTADRLRTYDDEEQEGGEWRA